MRRALLLASVAASAFIAAGAMADVTVTGTVDICTAENPCNFVVRETLTKTKTVTIDVDINIVPDKFGEASTHFNQRNTNNQACENCAEKRADIDGSVGVLGNGNTGITSVNQAAGNNNNQGTVISVALDVFQPPSPSPSPSPSPNPPGAGGFAESQVAGEQIISDNDVFTVNITFRDAHITNSIQDNVGITAVNQAAGNINNQSNAISLAVSLQNGVALSDAALGQFVVNNSHSELNVSKTAITLNSIVGNTGITQVNQSAGNLGNQSNVVSVATTFSPVVGIQ